ncbi:MAG: hypothetical protein JWN23_2700 [Rhodocyclales bacterium]|nr:hypothetical protein [Rhodocyclales bacterium]
MKDIRKQIGICDESFELLTVRELIERGIIERPIDGNHGETHPKTSDFVQEGIPFVMASDLKNGHIDYGACSRISEKQAEGLRKGFARNGDVLLTHKATIGETAIVAYDEHPYIMLTPQVTYYRVRDNTALNNRYLKYYFDSSLFQQTLQMMAGSGATRAYLGILEQQRLPVILPPPEKQKKIAVILGGLDDLIENNRHRIALLEKMAEEIYCEWFIRLRFPGHETAKFIKGVPDDWTVQKLPDVAAITYGFPFQAERFNTAGTGKPIIRIRNIQNGFSLDFTDEIADEKYVVRRGDLLIGMDGEFHMNHWQDQDAYLVQRSCRIKACDPRLEAYLSLALKAPIKHFEATIVGATVGHLGAKHLQSIDVLVPTPAVVERLEVLNQLLAQKIALSSVSQTLKQARDALLPRLISGKLSVEALDIQFPAGMHAA